ncbi:MAG: preprotein translocase subunit SecA [Candidatus Dadabacteria bacterium]|nr:preprotein translocase subunit SecA [Candidatus Dadabacteria bacterium]NIS08722.1 preprotein translocase subunit SecA [Candidatus Dadabacteria bacterium]NIV42606.1 preprotein translocase subunit SecA [Candidatus Dadabacteria bacterium]NIX15408.1 preprotein translocase subunit SecA [Candidatus Dadabacteria bacterium]NIY22071.1 preprotein translocase subunit SecA [Candidatus Dadabacteria bacterium]
MISFIMKKIVGSQNTRQLKKMQSVVESCNEYEEQLRSLPISELTAKSAQLRAKIKETINSNLDTDEDEFFEKLEDTLAEILPEAFALVREASKRTLGMRHFDVQILGGISLHNGNISEMKTGEGKTLVASLPLFLNGLTGYGAHLITVNDYLARRDAMWMAPIYKILGLKVGVINHEVSYLIDWEDETKAQKAIDDNLSVWPAEFADLEIPPDRNLDALTSFKTKLTECSRQDAYRAEITYGTNNEFGFDYLRDNMKFSLEDYVQKEHNFGIVDEVDSILIDEARTPLIISGPSEDSTERYYKIDSVVKKLKKEVDFTIDEKTKQVTPTEEGSSKVENILGITNVYDPSNLELLHHVIQGLRAHHMFQNDVDYIVKEGQVVIVDEFTGRLMPGRRWSDGLHQAIEAKEGVQIENENQTLATITIQNYFRMYRKLSGMTGTADTEAFEFKNIYKLDVSVIPTNKEMIRDDQNDVIYKTEKEKLDAVVKEIKEINATGRPILVGTTSIENSEKISRHLQKSKIKFNVLNAKQHEKEAHIVAQAGRIGSITIATNMAGRGTDIILGGNPEFLAADIAKKTYDAELSELEEDEYEEVMIEAKNICDGEKEKVLELGGLHIIGTERHESRRIDNQLRGRAGRQGDPGSSRFYVALDDDLMRIFASEKITSVMDKLGWKEGEPIEASLISKSIENAQKKVESRNFDIRKHLLEYDDVLNTQRDVIYTKRKEILSGENIKEIFYEIVDETIQSIVYENIPQKTREDEVDYDELSEALKRLFNLELSPDELKEYGLDQQRLIDSLNSSIKGQYEQKEDEFGEETLRQIEKFIILQTLDTLWKDHLLSMDHLREGIGLRGYAQKDPLREYRKEGYETFTGLLERFNEEVCNKLFLVQPVSEVDIERLERRRRIEQERMVIGKGEEEEKKKPMPIRREKKIGRNELCPCGSGKKYKKCCGKG